MNVVHLFSFLNSIGYSTIASNGTMIMNDELGRICKGATVAYFKVLPLICLEGRRKTTKM